jgi:hypothetical protein
MPRRWEALWELLIMPADLPDNDVVASVRERTAPYPGWRWRTPRYLTGGGRRSAAKTKDRNGMMSFDLAKELKNAGFFQSVNPNAVYFLNNRLQIRREDALKMWYGDKHLVGLDLDLAKEAVYAPTLSELVIGCAHPFYLHCDETGRWYAGKTANDVGAAAETAEEAVGRHWLFLQSHI